MMRIFLTMFICLVGTLGSCHLAVANEKMPMIVNGSRIAIADVPWQVLVTTNKGTYCGGTLVYVSLDDTSYYVLTAAHCVDEGLRASDVYVTTGIDDLLNRATTMVAADLMIHPNYNATNFVADIALVRVRGTLPAHAKPIALADSSVNADTEIEFSAGLQQNLFVSGWGRTSTNSSSSRYLQSTYLDGVADRQCRWVMHGGNYSSVKADAYVCANQPEGAGICNGDSGGPLVWQDQNHAGDDDRGYRLLGVVSFRHKYNGCGDPNTEDGFTQVSHYFNWVSTSISEGYARPYETFEHDIFAKAERTSVPPVNESQPDTSGIPPFSGTPPSSDSAPSHGSGSMGWFYLLSVGLIALRRRLPFS